MQGAWLTPIDFSAGVRTADQLADLMKSKTPDGTILAMKAMWTRLYNAPSNDPRLLSLTHRELSEEIGLQTALTIYLEHRKEELEYKEAHVDPEVAKKYDRPMLTGHPDYDRWELEETAVERQFK